MKSMTGFGSATAKAPHKIQVNIKSVNGRYLEPRFHMGREFVELESELKKRLSHRVRRGSVDVFINCPKNAHTQRHAKVDQAYVKELLGELRHTSRKHRLSAPEINALDLVQLPGVMDIEENYVTSSEEKKVLLQTFDRALQRLMAEKGREGQSLKRTLSGQMGQLMKLVRGLKGQRKKLKSDLESKLKKRLGKKGAPDLDPSRLGQEMIFYLDRADIAEEITRLEEHIKACQKLLSSDKEVGKRLDFFCQELLREVNTVGSKSSSAELTRTVVDAKTLVESIREQVQNVE